MLIHSTRQGAIPETGKPGVIPAHSEPARKSKGSARSERQPDLARLQRWALIGNTQQRIASAQSSEQALGLVWSELRKLDGQLAQQRGRALELNGRLSRLEQHVSGEKGPLTADLKPRLLDRAPTLTYQAEGLDLLTTKGESERLWISFPVSAAAVEVSLPAGASPQEVLSRLNQALQGEQISARRGADGQLTLTLPEGQRRKLDEPVLLRGEGVRLPAGNPIPVRFKQSEGELGKIEKGLSRGEIAQEQQRIRKLLADVEQSVRELKQFRQRAMQQLKQVQSRSQSISASELEQLQSRLSEVLTQGFAGTMSGLLAQANVSRQTVVALLT